MAAALLQNREAGLRPFQQIAEGCYLLFEVLSAGRQRKEEEARAGRSFRLEDEEIASRFADGVSEKHGSGIESRAGRGEVESRGGFERGDARGGAPDLLLDLRMRQ